VNSLSQTREMLSCIAEKAGEWAGLPMGLEGERLIVEPSYPWASIFNDKPDPDDEGDDGWRLRNKWYSRHHRCDIILMEREGKVDWGKVPAFHHISHDLRTLGCSAVWTLEQEANAVELLADIVRGKQIEQYFLTGMFLESSKRSGVMYLFRRLKPTVAFSMRGDDVHILAALCMHPIAYYADSWAGAMCPTDDVIAHLTMMRGDEHMFWKRCNQHPAYRPEAGL
jgi:hypothetical protein